jgi:hypothetical protein
MSIAELIMQGTEQNTKSTAWVSDSLQKLGQQVGTALKEKEQQRQALEVMPFLQQNMQESMQLAQKGQSGEAYSKMFSVMNPQTLNNPQLLPFIKLGFDAIGKSTDDYQRNRQLGMMETMYGQRYGGTGTVAPDIKTIVNNLNQGKDPKDTGDTTYDQGGGYSQGVPVMTEQTGMAFGAPQPFPFAAARQASPTLQQSQGVPAMVGDQPIDGELPVWDTPSEMRPPAQGPVQAQPAQPQPAQPEEQYKPPQNMIDKYLAFSTKFDKLSSVERATVMDNQSILFPDQKKATDFINQPSKDKSFFPVNPVTAIGVPGVVAVEMPKEYEKWIESTVNVNKDNDISYSLKPEAQNKPEAQAAMKWLQDWQRASIAVSSDPKLRSLIDKAGGDILKVDLTQVDRPATLEELDQNSPKNIKENLASVQGADGENIQLTDYQFNDLKMLRGETGAAQTNKARFIRVDQPAKKSAEATTKTEGGIPAIQTGPVAPQVPEEAAQLQQIVQQGQASKAGERAKSTENRIKEIDAEIKQLSAPSRQSGSTSMRGMFPSSGATLKSEKQKSPEQAQADIQRIMQLKAQKDALQGKKTGQKIEEGSIVEQGGKRYKFTNGKPVLIN